MVKKGFQKLHNNSIAKKLNKVGGELLVAEEKELMGHITNHLKEHPEQKAVVWRLLNSNLIDELMTQEGEKVPPCTTKLSKVSKHLRKRFLKEVTDDALDAAMVKSLTEHDTNIVERLFFYLLQEDGQTKVAERLVDDLFQVLSIRSEIVGSPGKYITIKDGKVDWAKSGVYHLDGWVDAKGEEVKEVDETCKATCVIHRFSGLKVSQGNSTPHPTIQYFCLQVCFPMQVHSML